MSKPTFLVATGTGTVAPAVVRALSGRPDVTVRVGFHDVSKAGSTQQAENVEPIAFDFEDDDSMRAALQGVDKVCFITPGAKGYHIDEAIRFVALAAATGVGHIVRISMVWASDPTVTFGRWHREIEESVEGSGLAWTILRSQPLMDNFVAYTPPDPQGSIYMPVGDGATAYISADDVGEAASAALMMEGEGQVHLLSGPAAIRSSDVADAIGGATSRSVQYVDVPAAAARQAMQQAGVPTWLIEGQLECYESMKRGETAGVTDSFERLTSRKPRSFQEFARQHADAWRH